MWAVIHMSFDLVKSRGPERIGNFVQNLRQ